MAKFVGAVLLLSLALMLDAATIQTGSSAASSGKSAAASAINPIRRVVTLLQQMQNKVEAEGKRDEELFEKYMCYCKTGKGSLEGSIASAETKIPQVESALKETEEKEAQA